MRELIHLGKEVGLSFADKNWKKEWKRKCETKGRKLRELYAR